MQSWQSSFLGIRALPRDLSEFELQAFFSFGADERRLIETRRTDAHQLGLALHIGFIRLSGQLLDAKRIVPVRLWQHLGGEIGVPNPEVATLKAMYRRGRTLLDHQRLACDQLGVSRMREHQRRALVRALRDEVQRSGDSDQLLVFARTWLYRQKLLLPHTRALRAIVTAALVAFESATVGADAHLTMCRSSNHQNRSCAELGYAAISSPRA